MKKMVLITILIFYNTNQSFQSNEARKIEQIGNPIVDIELCGRRGMRSNVCDPDGLISVEQAYRLDNQIRSLYNDTICVCPTSLCRIGGEGGYVVGVALIRQMKLEPNVQMLAFSNDDGYAEAVLQEGRWFAYQLLNKWRLGKCQEDLVIFYSMEDNLLYTITNTKTSQILTDDLISSATQESMIYFYEREQIFDGIKFLLTIFKSILQLTPKTRVNNFLQNSHDDFGEDDDSLMGHIDNPHNLPHALKSLFHRVEHRFVYCVGVLIWAAFVL